jgi:hypothetical protein
VTEFGAQADAVVREKKAIADITVRKDKSISEIRNPEGDGWKICRLRRVKCRHDRFE